MIRSCREYFSFWSIYGKKLHYLESIEILISAVAVLSQKRFHKIISCSDIVVASHPKGSRWRKNLWNATQNKYKTNQSYPNIKNELSLEHPSIHEWEDLIPRQTTSETLKCNPTWCFSSNAFETWKFNLSRAIMRLSVGVPHSDIIIILTSLGNALQELIKRHSLRSPTLSRDQTAEVFWMKKQKRAPARFILKI